MMVQIAGSHTQSLWSASSPRAAYPKLTDSKAVDLVVVGGGYTGCAAALQASAQGAKTVLLEAGQVGQGGSGRNVGLVNAGLWLPPQRIEDQIGEMAGHRLNEALLQAPDLVFSLIEAFGIECDATRSGTLHCAHSRSGLKALQRRAEQVNQRGGAVSVLSDAEAQSRVGTDQIHGALFDPAAGTLHPLKYCIGLAAAAKNAGAEIFEDSAVTIIEKRNNAWRVVTSDGEVDAAKLLIATNAYRQDLFGAPTQNFTPVHYFQLATEPLSENVRGDILSGNEGCWDTAPIMSSYRFDAQGRLIIGSVGALGKGAIRGSWARRKLARLFPRLKSAAFDFAWHGKIAMTSDHIPKVIELGPNGYSVFGYSGRGIGPGTVFGKMAAEALLREDPTAFPVAPRHRHDERFTNAKSTLYQWGANAFLSADCRLPAAHYSAAVTTFL